MLLLGIDVGGSGIKGAPVDVDRGELAAERHRVPTPQPSTPDAMVAVIAEIAQHFSWRGPLGCTFPGIVKHGTVYSAANVHKSWVGVNGQQRIAEATGCPTLLLNDADAAGLAEVAFGAGRGEPGVVLLVTLGTGIGSALFVDGLLVPNTELGHIEIRGKDAESRAADRSREEHDLSWKKWARRLDEYLERLEALFSPDLFILGGGVSKDAERFLPLLHRSTRVVPAQLLNQAGIVGAALAARALATPESAAPPPEGAPRGPVRVEDPPAPAATSDGAAPASSPTAGG